MIKRETIMAHRRVVNKMDYRPTAETVRMLCDGALELLDALEGGPTVQKQRAEIKERERQVGLALADLHGWATDLQTLVDELADPYATAGTGKVRHGIYVVQQMLKARGPKWKNEWSWWKPQIDEEFGE